MSILSALPPTPNILEDEDPNVNQTKGRENGFSEWIDDCKKSYRRPTYIGDIDIKPGASDISTNIHEINVDFSNSPSEEAFGGKVDAEQKYNIFLELGRIYGEELSVKQCDKLFECLPLLITLVKDGVDVERLLATSAQAESVKVGTATKTSFKKPAALITKPQAKRIKLSERVFTAQDLAEAKATVSGYRTSRLWKEPPMLTPDEMKAVKAANAYLSAYNRACKRNPNLLTLKAT